MAGDGGQVLGRAMDLKAVPVVESLVNCARPGAYDSVCLNEGTWGARPVSSDVSSEKNLTLIFQLQIHDRTAQCADTESVDI